MSVEVEAKPSEIVDGRHVVVHFAYHSVAFAELYFLISKFLALSPLEETKRVSICWRRPLFLDLPDQLMPLIRFSPTLCRCWLRNSNDTR